MTITRKLVLTYILIAIFPTVIITLVSLQIMSSQFSKELIQKGNASLFEAEAFINGYFDQGKKIAVFLANSRELKDQLFSNSIEQYLETFKDFIDIAVVEVFDSEKKLLKRVHIRRDGAETIFTDPESEILDQTLNLVKISKFCTYENGLGIKVSEPIIDTGTLEIKGAVIVSFPFNDVMIRYVKARIKTDVTILFNQSDKVISTLVDVKGKNINRIWENGISDFSIFNKGYITRNEKIGSHYYTVSYDLIGDSLEKPIAILSTAINRDSIETSRWNAYRALLFCSGGVLFIVIIIGMFVARSITRPINKLLASTRMITQGELEETIDTNRNDELGVLAQGFAHMRDAVRKQIKDLSQLNTEIVTKNEKLKRYRLHLVELVKERTSELHSANRRLEAEVRETQIARQAAVESNNAKTEFLANMSHEIRTPLNALLGFSELLSVDLNDPKHESYIEAMRAAGKNLLTLINDILDLSKIEAGKMELKYEPVNLKILLTEIEYIFKEKITSKGVRLVVDLAKDFPTLLILDETRIRQILLNLVGNAAKFTEKGLIKLTAQKKDAHTPNSVDLIIKIEDTGQGIEKKELHSIFESFKQVHGGINRRYGGTGLGLAICKRLTEAMNGQIHVTSKIGVGTTFSVRLKNVKIPPDELRKEVNEEHPDKPGPPCFEKKKILIVDDIESNRFMLKELLIKFNQDILEAGDGPKALMMAKENHPDIIIMDIRMPVMDGNQATKILKSDPHTQKIPVIAFTGDVVAKTKAGALKNGYDGYLTKPVKIQELINELSKYIKVTAPDKEKNRQDQPLDGLVKEDIIDSIGLVSILKKDILPLRQTLEQAMVIGQIREFGDRLLELGKKHNVQPLIRFSQDLIHLATIFNIEGMKKKLRELPVIIEFLVEMLENSDK